MKVKVGQWLRRENEIDIIRFKGFRTDKTPYIAFRRMGIINTENSNYIIKDTPQELIQVGDLVYAPKFRNNESRNLFEVCDIEEYSVNDKNLVAIFDEYGNDLKDYVEAIYTPNEDKTQYTEQWRKE